MHISSIARPGQDMPADPLPGGPAKSAADDVAKVAGQFESILIRQFLGDSMKPLLGGSQGGQFYGYLLNDALSQSLADAGGLGLSSVLQTQLGKESR